MKSNESPLETLEINEDCLTAYILLENYSTNNKLDMQHVNLAKIEILIINELKKQRRVLILPAASVGVEKNDWIIQEKCISDFVKVTVTITKSGKKEIIYEIKPGKLEEMQSYYRMFIDLDCYKTIKRVFNTKTKLANIQIKTETSQNLTL